MDMESRVHCTSRHWPLLCSVVFVNVCLPSLVLSYGVLLAHSVSLGVPVWQGLASPALFILTYGLTQCWCREAADSWGGPVGYRVLAALGLGTVVGSLVACAFMPLQWIPFIYGVFGGLGSSMVSAQVDAVIYETYASHLGLIRGICFTGQAVGQSIFPHIIQVLIDYYGYSMAHLVLGGIMLQTLPAVILLKVDEMIQRPKSFSRYSDLSKTYAIFNNGEATYYNNDLQLHDLNKKCWQSPSDDSLHEGDFPDDVFDNHASVTITPPPSPEEKRRNLFGVEILPEIPEESEDSDEEPNLATNVGNSNQKRLSVAIKRLSVMGDNFSEYITKQIRRDSQQRNNSENKNDVEIEITYDHVSPIDVERERILNSFSFRCQSAYASLKRRMWMPSYRLYRIKRRWLYLMYSINDTFIKPLTRAFSSWRFYPAVMLCFTRLALTAMSLVLLPIIASEMHPMMSVSEANFLMTLHGFTWVCFLLSTPWLAQTPKRNFKYVTLIGLMIATAACFVLAEAQSHDMYSIGCVVAGLGYGAISSCWETAAQDFVGARKWPKLHSTLETISGIVLAVFVFIISMMIHQTGNVQNSVFIQAVFMLTVTFIWMAITIVELYMTKMGYLICGMRWQINTK